jgi:hypothetical protein
MMLYAAQGRTIQLVLGADPLDNIHAADTSTGRLKSQRRKANVLAVP